jgi:hypothetical protein
MKERDMSKQSFLAVFGAGVFSLFALALAHAGEAPAQRHAVKAPAAKHVSARTLQRSYARMPADDEIAPAPSMSSPNLFETGRPPAQPGPAH